jgi:uncharacterized protein (TIGR03086 family)
MTLQRWATLFKLVDPPMPLHHFFGVLMSTAPLHAAITSTRAELAAVGVNHLDAATPCESWKVRDLINHLIGAQSFFLTGIDGTPPAAPGTDFASGDFLAAFDDASTTLLAAFSAEGVLEKTLSTPIGPMPGAAFIGLAMNDTFVHGWDLAKSLGRSTDLAPDLAAGLLERARTSIPEAFRGDDGKKPFGVEQQAPAGATNADQLAAFLGRKF